MAHKIQIKRGNKADIPVLNDGEMGLCIDTQEVFVGCNGTNIPVSTNKRTVRLVVGTSTSGWTEKDCDYLCDGTNDQEEIIQALNALPATGGEVVILDGTYNITASINIPKDNVSIRGSGNATTLKRMYNSTNTDSGATAKGLITLNEKSGCKIQGLQIDGNKATYTASYNYGIYLYSSSNNTVTGNTCNNNNNYGIYLYSSSDNTVTGNTCNNNSYNGIRLSSSSDNTITGNTCNNNNSNGIYLSSSSNNTVTGNTCIRGIGTPEDYTTNQHTILLSGTGNDYNLISSNNCMGKAPVVEGGTGNTVINNKWNATSDFEDLRTDVGDKTTLTTTDKTNLVNAVNETKAQINSLADDVNLHKMPISGGVLENYSEKLVTLSGTATTINLSLGNVFTHSLTGNTTYTISNAVSGQAHSFTLIINMGSTVRTLTFPASVKWQGGEIPDMSTANKTYVLTFMTIDGGTNWLGMFGGEF